MRNIRLSLLGVLLTLPLQLLADGPPATIKLKALTHTSANKMVVASLRECSKRGYSVAAAVVGRNGDLLAFLRNPLAGPHTEKVSQRKAFSAATFKTSTKDMQARKDLNFAPGILLIQGGVPISIGGTSYGGIAVAGAAPNVDELCAQAGINAIKEDILFSD